jgi:cell division protein FtsL
MITIEEATATLPISMSLTGIFWIAVVVAALGVVTRIYHGKLLKRLEGVVPRK